MTNFMTRVWTIIGSVMIQVNIHEAKTHLSRYIEKVEQKK